MNKTDLVKAVADKSGLSPADAKLAIDAIFDAADGVISTALQADDDVLLPGFGKFSAAHRAARAGRNPSTGAAMQIKASVSAKFKVGSNLKAALN